MKRPFVSDRIVTRLFNEKGIFEWNDALRLVRTIPYGRNPDRVNFLQVLQNEKGTCSSKHALLKILADENGWKDVKLILGMYRMSGENTPATGPVLKQYKLGYIPEAHCYLSVAGERIDVTSRHSDIRNVLPDILEEQEIIPSQVGDCKVLYHQSFLKEWIQKEKIPYQFDEIWSIREKCIAALSFGV